MTSIHSTSVGLARLFQRVLRRLDVVLVVMVIALSSRTARAEDENTPAKAANRGFTTEFGPVILFPSDGGPAGGGLDLDLRYGIEAGPVIVAPGARLDGYYFSGRFVGMAMPAVRLTLPIGPFAPFVVGGVGGGWISNPAENGLAFLGGGGLVIHLGRVVAIGVEATYQTIKDTEFEMLAIGPTISFLF